MEARGIMELVPERVSWDGLCRMLPEEWQCCFLSPVGGSPNSPVTCRVGPGGDFMSHFTDIVVHPYHVTHLSVSCSVMSDSLQPHGL